MSRVAHAGCSEATVAPGYFKKAISEHGSEWSTHPKIIDMKVRLPSRGHRRRARDAFAQGRKFVSECVPKNFAYFHVEFGISSGFIHVIDDEQEFPRTFGADVIAGVLEIPGELIARLKRKPAQEVMQL